MSRFDYDSEGEPVGGDGSWEETSSPLLATQRSPEVNESVDKSGVDVAEDEAIAEDGEQPSVLTPVEDEVGGAWRSSDLLQDRNPASEHAAGHVHVQDESGEAGASSSPEVTPQGTTLRR